LSLGEFAMIDRLLKPLAAGFPGALGLEDDAGLVACPPGHELVIAKDAIVAGVHFLPDDPADLIAGKLLRVNLSDLAAMGAEPLAYLTVIARPPEIGIDWLERFTGGLARDQARFGLHLMGGDTVSTAGPLVLTLTIIGTVPVGRAIRRRGARAGDLVLVSGTLGDAAQGLRVLKGLAASEDEALTLVDRYRTPEPRVALGQALRGLATAMIDVSDGLLADLDHLLDASCVGAEIEAAALPISHEAAALPGAIEAALSGGDDYELLLTASPDARSDVARAAAMAGTPLTEIGRITQAQGLVVRDRDGRELQPVRRGWTHF